MRRGLVVVVAAVALLSACTGDDPDVPPTGNSPAPSPAAPIDTGVAASSASDAEDADAAFLPQLQQKLAVPPVPAFTIPTDLLVTQQDRDLADQLQLEPGLYQGIAVVGVRCDEAGEASPVDSGTALMDSGTAVKGTAGQFDDGVRTITVGGDGTGV